MFEGGGGGCQPGEKDVSKTAKTGGCRRGKEQGPAYANRKSVPRRISLRRGLVRGKEER